ncbi:site-2 protease family protein [Candidatus Uhrbacteria bacterium]|nr:site-2 protease family protein [Candidatus Uhrbacteria bacterium]
MLTLLIFLLVLSVLVFVHEFGHFITAKRAGLRVDEFGFGFPPRVVGIQRVNGRRKIVWGNPKDFKAREGGTVYSINALPFGGFVRIKGESGEEIESGDSFAGLPAYRRVWIIAAGVLMNALLAVVLISGGFALGFPQVIEDDISAHARIQDRHVEVMGVLPGGPAERAGIAPGARIISLNGQPLEKAEAVKNVAAEFLSQPIRVEFQAQGQLRQAEVTPIILEKTKAPGIGVMIADVGTVRYPLWLAVPKAVEITAVLSKTIVVAFAELIRDAVLGRPVGADLTGPVGIAVLTGQAARQGLVNLLQFMAILSINLAILNVLPFPALDGGRILFILIEKLRGRPVARRVEGWVHAAGFVLLILLVAAVSVRDVGRYGGRIVEVVKNALR